MIGRSAYDRHLDPPEPTPTLADLLEQAGLLSDEDWDWYDGENGRWERLEKALEWAVHIGYVQAQDAIAEAQYIETYYEDWERQGKQADDYWRQRDEDEDIDLILASEGPAEEWRR